MQPPCVRTSVPHSQPMRMCEELWLEKRRSKGGESGGRNVQLKRQRRAGFGGFEGGATSNHKRQILNVRYFKMCRAHVTLTPEEAAAYNQRIHKQKRDPARLRRADGAAWYNFAG